MSVESAERPGPGGEPQHEFFYFVDGKRYDWPSNNITGQQIKASIPGLNPAFQIIQEGHGSEPDHPISESETFTLSVQGRGPLRFYTAPPATFGDLGPGVTGAA